MLIHKAPVNIYVWSFLFGTSQKLMPTGRVPILKMPGQAARGEMLLRTLDRRGIGQKLVMAILHRGWDGGVPEKYDGRH